jgi:hypothetical protein
MSDGADDAALNERLVTELVANDPFLRPWILTPVIEHNSVSSDPPSTAMRPLAAYLGFRSTSYQSAAPWVDRSRRFVTDCVGEVVADDIQLDRRCENSRSSATW